MMGSTPHLVVQEWWKQYGDVFSVYMGNRLVVVVNGLETMKECFIKQAELFNGRPDSYFKRITKGKGLVFSEGQVWREHRRFTLSCLRDFGMGKVVLEHRINDEFEYLLREIWPPMTSEASRDINPAPTLSRAFGNIICSIIYGTRFDYNDETFSENVYCLNESIRQQTMMNAINFMPWLQYVFAVLPLKRKLKQNVQQRERYAQTQLDSHLSTPADVTNPRDFMDAYLGRMKVLQERNKETTFEVSHLKRAIQDLFIAGTESLATTISWALLFMAINDKVQSRVHDELDAVVGSSRPPQMSDRPSLPYTEATLMECQRLGNIALFNVPRCTSSDIVLNGYRIPQGTWVFANRWGMHMSERYWWNPQQFDPGRFLDATGRLCRPEPFTPFGMGPRSCLGETLAKMELFIVFSRLLQIFSFTLPPGTLHPSLEPKVGINLAPQPYQIRITLR
jgi:cytochrome P450